jgi:hypothetical protein
MKGRLFEYFAVDTNIINNQIGQERYQEAWGDIAAAEVLKAHLSPDVPLPNKDTRVRRKWLLDMSIPLPKVLYSETLNMDGSLLQVVENAEATSTSTTTTTNAQWKHIVLGRGKTTTINITPTGITVDFNGESTGTFDGTGITFNTTHRVDITSTGNTTVTAPVISVNGETTINGNTTINGVLKVGGLTMSGASASISGNLSVEGGMVLNGSSVITNATDYD